MFLLIDKANWDVFWLWRLRKLRVSVCLKLPDVNMFSLLDYLRYLFMLCQTFTIITEGLNREGFRIYIYVVDQMAKVHKRIKGKSNNWEASLLLTVIGVVLSFACLVRILCSYRLSENPQQGPCNPKQQFKVNTERWTSFQKLKWPLKLFLSRNWLHWIFWWTELANSREQIF